MLSALLMLIPIGVIAMSSEYLWRKKRLRGEGGRKFVHILAGIWVSFWPYFISFRTIQFLSAFLLVLLIASKYLHIFHAVHDVKRRTLGELFYPLAILFCALLTPPDWVFTLAMLFLALSDGMAAVVGTRFKKKAQNYLILGQKKSMLGTMTYFAAALLASFAVFKLLSPDPNFYFADYAPVLFMIAVASTALENLLPFGTDNLVIPVLVVLALR